MGEDEPKYPTWKVLLIILLGLTAWLAREGFSSVTTRIDKTEKMVSDSCTRLTVIEENYKALREDNGEIKQAMKEMTAAVNALTQKRRDK